MSIRVACRRDLHYDYTYQWRPGLHVTDSGPATCAWCGGQWASTHRLQYSPCCGSSRVQPGAVSLMRLSRHPKLRPIFGDVFRWRGLRCCAAIEGDSVLVDGFWRVPVKLWLREARIARRGDV
jgi:hypothetical protein